MYSLVIFDWDGTLMDSTPSIVAAIQGACRDLALPVPTDDAAAWVIGLSLHDALHKAVPSLTAAELPRFLERYKFHYLTRDPLLRLFNGIAPLFDELAALPIQLAVATGKSRVGLERGLDASGLRRFFHGSRTADETFSKPHPAMLQELMRELDVAPEHTLMIGDTSHDLNMARHAGTASLGVTYGAHSVQELEACSPDGLVDTVPELRSWLLPRLLSAAA
jgi:phosphoglycolate phosphatase